MSKNPIDETLANPGATVLDEVLRRTPTQITDADLDAIIAHQREERTRFAVRAETLAARKEGIDEEEIDLGPDTTEEG